MTRISNASQSFFAFVTALTFFVLSISPAFSQVSPEEHARHHPDQAKGSEKGGVGGKSGDTMGGKGAGMMGGKGGGMMGGAGGGMMGGEGGGMMGGMMEKMGAPKPKELYPKLMELPNLPMEERARIRREAHQRMLEGTKLLSNGLDELAAAADTDDFQTMQKATARMREGLAQFESGLAAHRAIAEGKSPRNVALTWFKREMNILPAANEGTGFRLFGMTAFHTSIMALLIAFSAIIIWMYFCKMQRATRLMKQLTTAAPPTDGQAAIEPVASSHPVQPVPHRPAAVPDPPAKLSLPGSPAGNDCCDESSVACADEVTLTGQADISTGLLHVARRKLCRLRVTQIFQETGDVKTFRLVACHGGALPFSFLPGQFLTLTMPVGEKPIRRSYTISSSPTQGYYCEISVKREEQGAGSRYLHDKVKEGDTLEVQAPSGKFVFSGTEAASIVLISGGVGITPMMSITRALTDMGWQGDIYFIVACRNSEHFIFQAELGRLQARFRNLHVFVAMSRIEEPVDGYHSGRLTEELLSGWVPDISSKRVHLCGSPPMMKATKQMLSNLGVPADNIYTENFGSQQKPHVTPGVREESTKNAAADNLATETAASVSFTVSGKSTPLLTGENVLEAAEREGVDIDYSCRTGMCGVCTVKLLSGQVTMEVEDGLERDDKAAGMILACQAIAAADISVEA